MVPIIPHRSYVGQMALNRTSARGSPAMQHHVDQGGFDVEVIDLHRVQQCPTPRYAARQRQLVDHRARDRPPRACPRGPKVFNVARPTRSS